VNPNANETLKVSLNKASPIKYKGKVYHAHTDWKVKWAYTWKKKWFKCTLDKYQVATHIEYTFPKIKDGQKTSQLKKQFLQYKNKLELHEKGHANMGILAAKEVEEAIAKISSAKNCDQLKKKIEKSAMQIVKAYKQKDDKYDLKTKHGRTQGAYLRN